MKLKQRPEDFVVVELDEVPLGEGPYSIYRLSKTGIGTIEAVSQVARTLGVERRRVSFGGLKDKWAVTEQAISIQGGPRRDLKMERIALTFLGTSPEPVRQGSFERNRFRITMRDLSDGDVRHLERSLGEIVASGLPNYFDNQRFGSAKGTGDFIGRRLVRGEIEEALRLAIAAPSPDDRSAVKRVKAVLRECWGKWEECLARLPAGAYESRLVHRLARAPNGFAAAFEMIDRRLRLLYVSAYQSALWNRVLDRLVRRHGEGVFEKEYELGKLAFYRTLTEGVRERMMGLAIPLPRRGVRVADEEVEGLLGEVLKEEGLQMGDLVIRGLKATYFGRGERAAVMVPRAARVERVGEDELNRGRRKATVSFELPKGSYATILVKRIFH